MPCIPTRFPSPALSREGKRTRACETPIVAAAAAAAESMGLPMGYSAQDPVESLEYSEPVPILTERVLHVEVVAFTCSAAVRDA